MKTKVLYLFLLIILLVTACTPGRSAEVEPTTPGSAAITQPTETSPAATPTLATVSAKKDAGQNQSAKGGTPPQAAITACTDKKEQDACEFTSQKGSETGVCETVENQLACSPKHDPANAGQSGQTVDQQPGQKNDQPASNPPDASTQGYNIEQAISDKAQGMTISFDALAFMTGDLGSDSFFPPGKVADFWGFQYLRDNDPSVMGHAGDFLTSAAMNMLNTLTTDQRAQLVALAKSQVAQINEYGYKRFVLMKAFRRLVSGDLPAGTTGLNEEAVKTYSAELYHLDGQISFARAQLMGKLITSFDADQKAYLDAMVGGDKEHPLGMLEWPKVEEPADIKDLDRDVKVAVMTYAADMFSWYAGSVDADVYFCPERHGTYFGSFYLKDIPAMSNSSYAIPTNMTGDMGEAMLKILTPDQASLITGLVNIQKPSLQGIVDTRKTISTELRKFKDGSTTDSSTVLSLMDQYGQLDGEIIYNLAVNFTKVSQSLTDDQKTQLTALRKEMLSDLMHPSGAYLYSQAVPMPEIQNTDFLFK
jgi:hypothetical protein